METEAKRLDKVNARNRSKRIERLLDFAVIGTVGIAAGAAGLMTLLKVVQG